MLFRAVAGVVLAGLITIFAAPVVLAQDNSVVIMETSHGTITIELDSENAPISVDNFLAYVDAGHYDNTIFHRVIETFMIQGGSYSSEMTTKPTRLAIKNEAENGLANDRYSVAMARTGEVDSATDQFFINTADNDFLNNGVRDFGYAVFGHVTDGRDVVDEIARTPVTNNLPNEAVVIRSVRRQ